MLLKRLITNRNVHLGALLFGASRYMYRGHFSRRFFEFSKKKKKKTRKENESFFNSIYIYIFKMEKDLDHFAYIHVYIIDRSNEIDEKKDYVYLFFFPFSHYPRKDARWKFDILYFSFDRAPSRFAHSFTIRSPRILRISK